MLHSRNVHKQMCWKLIVRKILNDLNFSRNESGPIQIFPQLPCELTSVEEGAFESQQNELALLTNEYIICFIIRTLRKLSLVGGTKSLFGKVLFLRRIVFELRRSLHETFLVYSPNNMNENDDIE